MKKIALQKNWSLEGISQIKIDNEMAPLLIDASPDSELHLEALFPQPDGFTEFDPQDYLDFTKDGAKIKLDLLELPFADKQLKSVLLKLSVPAGTALKIETENYPLNIIGLVNDLDIDSENSPVSIRNCEGKLELESENGPVKLQDLSGNIKARLENGPLVADDISGTKLDVESENGPIKLRLASFSQVKAKSENGPIYYESLPVEGGNYEFITENGMVHLVLPLSLSFSLSAENESGRLKYNLDAEVEHVDGIFKVERLVSDIEPTLIKIETENGLIRLSSDGRIDLDFFKERLEYLKESLSKVENAVDAEKVRELIGKMSSYLASVRANIRDEKTKERITEAIEKLKNYLQDFDFKEAKSSTIEKVEEIGGEIYDNLKEGLRNVKAEFDELKYAHFNTDSLKDYVNKVLSSPRLKPYLGAAKKHMESEEIAERSRLKILDMLENGKITSEEAERLLNAIKKE